MTADGPDGLLGEGPMRADAAQWPRLYPQCHLSPRTSFSRSLRDYREPEPDQYSLEDDGLTLLGFGQSGRPTLSLCGRRLQSQIHQSRTLSTVSVILGGSRLTFAGQGTIVGQTRVSPTCAHLEWR